jgi:PAS domain S-box-containing protein
MSLDRIIALTDTLSRVELNLQEEMSILEFVLESITDGYWDWGLVKDYEYFSPKFKEQLGYVRMAPTPESWQKICNEDDLKEVLESVNKHMSGEILDFSQTLRLTHKDGHEITVLCRGVVVRRSADGSPLRMVGTHQLITDV